MTTTSCPPRSPPSREPLAPCHLRPEGRDAAQPAAHPTTWLRPRFSLSARGEGLAVQVEVASAPC